MDRRFATPTPAPVPQERGARLRAAVRDLWLGPALAIALVIGAVSVLRIVAALADGAA